MKYRNLRSFFLYQGLNFRYDIIDAMVTYAILDPLNIIFLVIQHLEMKV